MKVCLNALVVDVAYLPVLGLWKDISTTPTDKKLGQMKQIVML